VAKGLGVDSMFFPLATLGLLRLCAAGWLTEDFEYRRVVGKESFLLRGRTNRLQEEEEDEDGEMKSMEERRALDPFLIMPSRSVGFKEPGKCWKSWVFRICFLVVIAGIWGISLVMVTPIIGPMRYTTTLFFLGLFYFVSFTVSLFLYAFYFFRGQTTTTLLPCLSSVWYRLYTVLVMGSMLALVIVASIETNKGFNGIYTSWEPQIKQACNRNYGGIFFNGRMLGVEVGERWLRMNNGTKFPKVQVASGNVSMDEEFWMLNFTGYCMGQYDGQIQYS
jgi:hypothetical protein